MSWKQVSYIIFFVLAIGFFACKRSNSSQNERQYDPKLVTKLLQLKQQYAGKKVRINTWDKNNDAYTDLQITDENEQLSRTLTIGDSVQFVGLNFKESDGIRAIIKVEDSITCQIPYFKIEEFDPAFKFDPDIIIN